MFKALRAALLPPPKGTVFDAPETRAYCAAQEERLTNPPNLPDQSEIEAGYVARFFHIARERANHPFAG